MFDSITQFCLNSNLVDTWFKFEQIKVVFITLNVVINPDQFSLQRWGQLVDIQMIYVIKFRLNRNNGAFSKNPVLINYSL